MKKDLYDLKDPYEIARYIKEAEKQTTAKVYVSGDLSSVSFQNVKKFGTENFWVLIGDAEEIKKVIAENSSLIQEYEIENNMRNSAIPLLENRTGGSHPQRSNHRKIRRHHDGRRHQHRRRHR